MGHPLTTPHYYTAQLPVGPLHRSPTKNRMLQTFVGQTTTGVHGYLTWTTLPIPTPRDSPYLRPGKKLSQMPTNPQTLDWLNKATRWQLTAASLVALQRIPGLVFAYGRDCEKAMGCHSAFMASMPLHLFLYVGPLGI